MTILDHLCAVADTLKANADDNAHSTATRDAVSALRFAADSLYQAAELLSLGEPKEAPEVAFAASVAVLKLAEAAMLPKEVFGDLGLAYRIAVNSPEFPRHLAASVFAAVRSQSVTACHS